MNPDQSKRDDVERVARALYAASSRYFCAEDPSAAFEDCRRQARVAVAALACTCGVSEPDEFGNRDPLEDPGCPLHGETLHRPLDNA